MAQIDFNPLEHNPSAGFDVLPEGLYTGVVKETEVKTTSSGSGKFLAIQIEIVKGEHQGRVVFDNFNLVNPNADAVRIAQASLSALCHACGKLNPIRDSDELKGKPFDFKLGVEPASKGKDGKDYPAKNKVKQYVFKKEGVPAKPASAPAPSAPSVTIKDDNVPF